MPEDNPLPEIIGIGIALYQLGSWAFSKLNRNDDKTQETQIRPDKTTEDKNLSFTVYDSNKQPQKLDTELDSGGEGTVFPLNGRSDILVKIYHPEKMTKDGEYLKKKIEAMTALKNNFVDTPLCWPRIRVYDERGEWLGYAMKRGKGVSMNKFAHAVHYKKYFPHLDRSQIVQYLLNFIEAIALLHKSNIYVGDFNLNNFLCDPQSHTVTFIDCDSYQLSINGSFFPCLVITPDLTPLEHHGCDARKVVRSAESDTFSVAIILFKCLMIGRHPYDVVGGEDPVSNMRNGYFPYGTGTKGLPPGRWYNIWSHMPYRLKTLFIKNFTEGAKNPSARPTLAEWKEALEIYQKEIKKGFHEQVIIPSEPKKSERVNINNS
jgi:DNA-binding helix-hairpin-helix protein with protein kinase domain